VAPTIHIAAPHCLCADQTGIDSPNSGLSSDRANHVGVWRGFVSAYSQKELAGAAHREPLPNHRRRCGLETLRMFVTDDPPNCSGPGMPHRAMTSSRPSGLLRTIGANWLGKMPGNSGRLPVRSCLAWKQSRIAAWPLVKE
jgi:hypothetical protein